MTREIDLAFAFIADQVKDAWGSIDVAIESGWYGEEYTALLESIIQWEERCTAL